MCLAGRTRRRIVPLSALGRVPTLNFYRDFLMKALFVIFCVHSIRRKGIDIKAAHSGKAQTTQP